MRIVLTHGCFDILTMGHLEHFERSRVYGNWLTVSVSRDEIVAAKGPGRPIRPLDHRVRMLRAVRFIDEVVVCDTPDATGSILKVCPLWFVQGIDYAVSGPTARERAACEDVGAQWACTSHPKNDSTTAIVERIRACAS
jgi:cytidyltransferase-like protein